MKLSEIIKKTESCFPPDTAYSWDNVGLLAGHSERDIKKILVTLDVTEETVNEAIAQGAQLILSHHPILFSGIKRVTDDSADGRILLSAIENGIAIYAAHTNCDIAPSGINARLSELLCLQNAVPLEENGLGRIGILSEEMTFRDFALFVKERLSTPFVRAGGDENRIIRRVAVGSGACADSIPAAISGGADVMVTADMKYHEMLDSIASGINVIDAGHYPTEIIVTDIFAEILADLDVSVIKSHNTDIFKYI